MQFDCRFAWSLCKSFNVGCFFFLKALARRDVNLLSFKYAVAMFANETWRTCGPAMLFLDDSSQLILKQKKRQRFNAFRSDFSNKTVFYSNQFLLVFNFPDVFLVLTSKSKVNIRLFFVEHRQHLEMNVSSTRIDLPIRCIGLTFGRNHFADAQEKSSTFDVRLVSKSKWSTTFKLELALLSFHVEIHNRIDHKNRNRYW